MAGFLNPISSKTKGEREKERARRKKVGEEKKAMVALLVFILATLEIFGRKNCWTQKIHLAITFSKTRLDVQGHLLGTQAVMTQHHFVAVSRHWFPTSITCGQLLSL